VTAHPTGSTTVRPRNDPRQYDDLVDQWWEPRGRFAMLHWIAEAARGWCPTAQRDGSLLLDLACGGGLLAPHLAGKGHRHVGLDLSPTALPLARRHGVVPVRGDVLRLPFATRWPTSWSRARCSSTSPSRCSCWPRPAGCCGRAAPWCWTPSRRPGGGASPP
jgi:SAM-dependent methyltransferase